MQLVQANGKLF